MPSSVRSTEASSSGLLTSQPLCGSSRIRAPLAPPRLSLPRNVEADAHAVETSCDTVRPEARTSPLERGGVVSADQLVVDRGHRVLPDQHLGRHLGAEVADDRAHVAVGQLEPGAGERVGERLLVLGEPPGDRLVDRVEAQRQVGGQHPRLALAVAERVRHQVVARAALGPPLVGARRALEQLPLVAEQDVEELVVPPGRVVGPGDLEPAGDRVGADAGAVARLPAEALLLDRRGLGVGADVLVRAGSVGLAEGVAAGDQRDGLLVVHRHPAERLADVAGRREGVRVAVGALRVDVDEAHLYRAERLLELASPVQRSSPSHSVSGPQ